MVAKKAEAKVETPQEVVVAKLDTVSLSPAKGAPKKVTELPHGTVREDY